MKLKAKHRLVLFLPLAFLLLVFALIFKRVSPTEYRADYILQQEYNGRILDKYRETNNHMYKRLIIRIQEKKVTLGCESWLDLYEMAEIGDSIVKRKGRGFIEIYRESEKIASCDFNTNGGYRIINRFKERRIN